MVVIFIICIGVIIFKFDRLCVVLCKCDNKILFLMIVLSFRFFLLGIVGLKCKNRGVVLFCLNWLGVCLFVIRIL